MSNGSEVKKGVFREKKKRGGTENLAELKERKEGAITWGAILKEMVVKGSTTGGIDETGKSQINKRLRRGGGMTTMVLRVYRKVTLKENLESTITRHAVERGG